MSHRAWFYTMLSKYKEGGRLLLFFAVALFLAFLVANGPATADVLLQSPQSPPPVEESQPEPPPTPPPPTPTPPPPTPTPVPTEPPPEPVEPAPAPQEQPVEAASTEAIQAEPTPEPPPAEPTPTPLPAIVEPQASSVQPVGPQPQPIELTQEEIPFEVEEEGAPNFILDQIELIDTLAVSGAYIWLCCGVGLLLLLPLFLLILYVRGRSRILEEETYY